MSLENTVLVKIKRSEFSGSIECHKRSSLNATDGVIYSLFEQAKQQMNRSAAKRFGFFDNASEHTHIIGLINNWQAKSINFLSFANKTTEYLQQQLDESDTPFSASLIFAEEVLLGQHYLYCFWLPMLEVIQAGDDLEPYRSESIEASKIQYGLRLHLDEWQLGDSPKYLTLLASKGNKDLGEAFKRFSNFSEGIDLSKQTNEFLQIVEHFSEELPEEQAQSVKIAVLDYCIEQDKVGNPVILDEISEQINKESPTKFAEFVTSKQDIPQKEIHTDRQSLKRYMRYFGRDNSLSISFSAERFGKDITYNPVGGSLSINKLPKNLKIQLSGYTEKSE